MTGSVGGDCGISALAARRLFVFVGWERFSDVRKAVDEKYVIHHEATNYSDISSRHGSTVLKPSKIRQRAGKSSEAQVPSLRGLGELTPS